MVCVNPNGRPTEHRTKMLQAMAKAALIPEQVAKETSLRLLRVRSGLRDLDGVGLATSSEGAYSVAGEGANLMAP